MKLTIRDATERDMPAVLEIYNATIPTRLATTDLQPVSLDERLLSFAHHHPDRRPFWVAEDGDGRIVGYCSLRDFYGRAAYRPTAEIALYVHSDHQRRGIGSALLAHAIADCPRLNLRTLLAFVFPENLPSMRLFERHGFERWGTLPSAADLEGRWMDVAILGYQRDLPPPPTQP